MIKSYIRIILPLLLIVAAFTLYTACSCNCSSTTEENTVKGYIVVIGNEPDTKLALKTDNDKIFILQVSKELKNELFKRQGNYYYIKYGDLQEENGVYTIVVEKIIPISSN